VQGTLVVDGERSPATTDAVTERIASSTPFWLDLDGVDDEVLRLLSGPLGFHRLAVDAVQQFDQRPKIDEFDGFTYLVVHGALVDPSTTTELHLFVRENQIVSVHRGDCAAVTDVLRRVEEHHGVADAPHQVAILYLLVDQLIDTFFPMLSEFDDRIDQLEDAILQQPTESQLGVLFEMKRALITVRRTVTPQRDMFASLASGVIDVPGMTEEGTRYFRDLYDHLIRIADLVDSYRDLLSGVVDTHVSTVSNRLNVVMKQLTIIATIFLPLSYLTGFFGQNFLFLTNHIMGPVPFLVFGLGIELFAALGLLYYFRRRGWLGGPTT
jgi:magnesium transporter